MELKKEVSPWSRGYSKERGTSASKGLSLDYPNVHILDRDG